MGTKVKEPYETKLHRHRGVFGAKEGRKSEKGPLSRAFCNGHIFSPVSLYIIVVLSR